VKTEAVQVGYHPLGFLSSLTHTLHRSQEGAESAPAEQPATDDAKAVRTV
jgi:hypothetical protein